MKVPLYSSQPDLAIAHPESYPEFIQSVNNGLSGRAVVKFTHKRFRSQRKKNIGLNHCIINELILQSRRESFVPDTLRNWFTNPLYMAVANDHLAHSFVEIIICLGG